MKEDRVLLRVLVPAPHRPERPNLAPRWRFVRGAQRPRGVVWFGLSSFWGHLRHFASVAIATENVDSRDWMTADDPLELEARVAQVLGAPVPEGSSASDLGERNLLAAIGRLRVIIKPPVKPTDG